MPSAAGALAPLLAACSDRLAARLGLHFPPERWPELQRGLTAAADELGCGDIDGCVAWLASAVPSTSQLEILARHLTVGETYFMRQPAAFLALRERILPELIDARSEAARRRLRIWSAGCSTGEEAYSIAITLAELLPDLRHWNVSVLGSDLNPHALAKAREAIYSEWSFRGAEAGFKERYFSSLGGGRYRLDRRIRSMVSFAPLNLAEDRYPAVDTNTNAMDLIFCRNVLMYFHPERVRAVVERLASSLVEGGWLVVSPVESTLVASPALEAHRLSGLVVFRKAGEAPGGARTVVETVTGQSEEYTAKEAGRRAGAVAGAGTGPAFAEAMALHGEGRYEEAARALERILARGRRDAEVLLLLARAHANRGRLVEALARCDEAVAAVPLDPAPNYLRASILSELGRAEAAAAAFKRTLYLDPECPLAHFGLGNLLARQGRRRDAMRHYRHASAILNELPPDRLLHEADGIPAGRLREMIDIVLGMELS